MIYLDSSNFESLEATLKNVIWESKWIILVTLFLLAAMFSCQVLLGSFFRNEYSPPFEFSLIMLVWVSVPAWITAIVLPIVFNYPETMSLANTMSIPVELAAKLVCDLNYLGGRTVEAIAHEEFLKDIDEYTGKGWIHIKYRELLLDCA